MSKKVLILTAIMSVFAASNLQAEQISVSWDGGGDGHSWSDPYNWNPNIVPDNNATQKFVVTIDSDYASVYRVEVGLRQSRDVNQVDCYGEVDLDKWTSDWFELTIYNGLTNHGYLEIDSVEIVGNITNLGGSELGLDNAEIRGNLYNQFEATIVVDYEVDVEQGGLENAGLIQIAPTGEIYVDQHFNNIGEILIYGGECGVDEGILDNNSTGVIKGFGFLFSEQLLQNKGEIYAYGGSLAVLSKGPLSNSGLLSNYPLSSLHIKPAADVNNNGTIKVNAGGVAFDCNLSNEPNGIIKLLGGTLAATSITQAPDANFAGFGGITVADEILIESAAKIELTGPTNIVGDVNIPANATLEISDGTTLITGHTTCNNGTIRMIGGRVICQGGLTNNNCNIIWEPGTYTNIADFNLDGTVNFKDFADFANTWLWQASWY